MNAKIISVVVALLFAVVVVVHQMEDVDPADIEHSITQDGVEAVHEQNNQSGSSKKIPAVRPVVWSGEVITATQDQKRFATVPPSPASSQTTSVAHGIAHRSQDDTQRKSGVNQRAGSHAASPQQTERQGLSHQVIGQNAPLSQGVQPTSVDSGVVHAQAHAPLAVHTPRSVEGFQRKGLHAHERLTSSNMMHPKGKHEVTSRADTGGIKEVQSPALSPSVLQKPDEQGKKQDVLQGTAKSKAASSRPPVFLDPDFYQKQKNKGQSEEKNKLMNALHVLHDVLIAGGHGDETVSDALQQKTEAKPQDKIVRVEVGEKEVSASDMQDIKNRSADFWDKFSDGWRRIGKVPPSMLFVGATGAVYMKWDDEQKKYQREAAMSCVGHTHAMDHNIEHNGCAVMKQCIEYAHADAHKTGSKLVMVMQDAQAQAADLSVSNALSLVAATEQDRVSSVNELLSLASPSSDKQTRERDQKSIKDVIRNGIQKFGEKGVQFVAKAGDLLKDHKDTLQWLGAATVIALAGKEASKNPAFASLLKKIIDTA
ncbi:MAG TPA: hypothetical protein VGT41_00160 [Candidatus Babeliales bacterium]|nr:hypothetical protein [Candidatus Babeliales bacterium]